MGSEMCIRDRDVQKLVNEIYALPKDVLAYADKVGNSREKTTVAQAVIPIATYAGKITKLKRGVAALES